MAPSRLLELTSMEPRLMPAAVLKYTDVDGDLVTIRTSKGTGEQLASIVQLVPIGQGMQLRTIFLNADQQFAGTDLSITAKKGSNGGDGLVNVGYIDAEGSNGGVKVDLGTVLVGGDLGEIDAGDGVSATPALKSLTVRSLGTFGTTTGAPTLQSDIDGRVGRLTVNGDIRNAFFKVRDTNGENGLIGRATIGGSIIGGSTASSGSIQVQDGLDRVSIGGDLVGGDEVLAGSIVSYGSLGGVRVGGSVIGGSANQTGVLAASLGDLKQLTIGGDLRGGSGAGSGAIAARSFGDVSIAGSVMGGSGGDSGEIFSTGAIGKIRIAKDIRGGSGVNSGYVDCGKAIASIAVGGSVFGGSASDTGMVYSWEGIGRLRIGHDLRGGAGANYSGTILTYGPVPLASIGGSVLGGTATMSGAISCQQSSGSITVGEDVLGGDGTFSGSITSQSALSKLTIHGSLVAGLGGASGRVGGNGATGSVVIDGDVRGGNAIWTGQVFSGDSLDSLRIGGSLLGGTGQMSGAISVTGSLGSATIGGDIRGGDAHGIVVADSGTVQARRVGRLAIGGSIVAGRAFDGGTLFRSGSLHANDDLGTILVHGNLHGNATNEVLITARGSAHPAKGQDVAIQSLTVDGSVEYSSILAGYSSGEFGQNADAQIGSVAVGGSWTASSVNAGLTIPFVGFGTGYETKLAGGATDSPDTHSLIGSLLIAGPVLGVVGSQQVFGFGAEEIGAARITGRSLPLSSGGFNDTFGSQEVIPVGLSTSFFTTDGFAVHVFECADSFPV
jgi:hypothetical protein